MTPMDGFEAAMNRADHLLRLYDVLCDTRSRAIRRDWAASFLDLMRWPTGEKIVRVDGKDKQSLLILRPSLGLDNTSFTHDYLSELLRSAVVATVSALDRYVHDLVLQHAWALLQRRETSIPTELKKLSLSVLATKRALDKLRNDPSARPGNLVKAALQEHLHRDHTFQRPDDLVKAAKMLGVKDFWGKVTQAMPGTLGSQEVIAKVQSIAMRRNQIVHEADIYRKTKAKQITLRDISKAKADEWCTWTRQLVAAIDQVVKAAV